MRNFMSEAKMLKLIKSAERNELQCDPLLSAS